MKWYIYIVHLELFLVRNVHTNVRKCWGRMRGYLKFSELFRRSGLRTSYPGWTTHGIKLFYLSQEPSELVSPVSSRSNKKFVKAGWLFRSGWLDGDHHHFYVSTALIPCKEFKQFENPCSPDLHHFWLLSGRKYNDRFWWKSLPIEEAGLQKWRKVAMKIELLVHSGEVLVEGLQLRKPEQDRVAWTRNRFVEEKDLFHVDTVVTSSGLSTGNVEQVTFKFILVMHSNVWVDARFTWPKGLP